jgi:hypothetical protein
MLDPMSIYTEPIFKDLCDIVFLDEKWFYITKKTGRYYILPQEEEPYRTWKNKNFIPKVMFLCVIARAAVKIALLMGKLGVFLLSHMNLLKGQVKIELPGRRR